jgi:hypothetical protein
MSPVFISVPNGSLVSEFLRNILNVWDNDHVLVYCIWRTVAYCWLHYEVSEFLWVFIKYQILSHVLISLLKFFWLYRSSYEWLLFSCDVRGWTWNAHDDMSGFLVLHFHLNRMVDQRWRTAAILLVWKPAHTGNTYYISETSTPLKYVLRSTNMTLHKVYLKNQNLPNLQTKKATKYVGKKWRSCRFMRTLPTGNTSNPPTCLVAPLISQPSLDISPIWIATIAKVRNLQLDLV